MNFSDYLTTVPFDSLPDWTQLGGRLFVADGRNPVCVHDGVPANDRMLGALPQQTLTASAVTGTGLEASAAYTYGVQRIVVAGALEVPSQVTTANVTTDTTKKKGNVTLVAYEKQPVAGAGWAVTYRILRSLKDVTTTLYKVADLTQAQFEALTTGLYEDTTADSALDQSVSVDLTAADANGLVPPVRCIRAWKGRLVSGGSATYTAGTLTVGAGDLDLATLAAPGVVHPADVGAYVAIEGEDKVFMVTAVNTTANTWGLDKACTAARTVAAYQLFRDFETVYVGNPLPDNIEGYTIGEEVISARGTNDPVLGIAVSAGYCYILRRRSVDVLDGADGTWQLLQHPATPPGCVSHATIADRYSPAVFYYAGAAGVVMMQGSEAKVISTPVRTILESEVDHSMDAWSHGVYDPRTGRYWLWMFARDWDDLGVRVPELCLCYDTTAGVWYRHELAASRSDVWRDADGTLIAVIGTAGGVCRLEQGDSDGVPYSGRCSAAGSSTTLVDSTATWPTENSGLAGQPVHVTLADGNTVRRLVKVNTATTLTIYGTWGTEVPAAGATYRIGSVRWAMEPGEQKFTNSWDKVKKLDQLVVATEMDTEANALQIEVRGVRKDAANQIQALRDMGADDTHVLAGNQLGLRGRSVRVRLSGDTDRPVTVLGLMLDSQEASR